MGENDQFPHTYLDNAGASLPTSAQLKAIFEELRDSRGFANPHGSSSLAEATHDAVEQARHQVLQHFRTNANEYTCVFTSGCTAALHYLAELFDFQRCPSCRSKTEDDSDASKTPAFVYLQDNHTSVLGMRETVKRKEAEIRPTVRCLRQKDAFDRFNRELTKSQGNLASENDSHSVPKCSCRNLFVYPGQSNFCGRKYPLSWTEKVHRNALGSGNWFVCIDAASLVSTSLLDLSIDKPDFVTLSFYKIFGYPTGLGVLLIRNNSAHALSKKYFGGGTVQVALPSIDFYAAKRNLAESLEDGTVAYQQIISLKHGFKAIELAGGIHAISERTFSLAVHVCERLKELRHYNGSHVAVIYAETGFESRDVQGGIVCFNLLTPGCTFVGYSQVGKMADAFGLQLRTGCFCNIGACQHYLRLNDANILQNFKTGKVCGDHVDLIDGQPVGAVRVSFGFQSQTSDALRFLEFIERYFVERLPTAIAAIDKADLQMTDAVICDGSGAEEGFLREKQYLTRVVSSQEIDTASENTAKMAKLNVSSQKCSHAGAAPVLAADFSADVQRMSRSDVEVHAIQRDIWRITDIFVYPVKSASAFKVTSWPICETGLAYDRSFAILTASGVCLSQKIEPQLCMLEASIDLENRNLLLSTRCSPDSGDEVLLLRLPLDNEQSTNQRNISCQQNARICRDRVSLSDCGSEASSFLSACFGSKGLRLVRQPNLIDRRVRENSQGSSISLVNQEQILLISGPSVRKLLSTLRPDFDDISERDLIARFRPNLVVDGPGADFEEESWREVQIGNLLFSNAGPCTRCQMICIDQLNGARNPSLLTRLQNLRKGKHELTNYFEVKEGVANMDNSSDVVHKIYKTQTMKYQSYSTQKKPDIL